MTKFYLNRGLRGWLAIANFLLGLMGVATAGFGGYMMWKAPSTFSDVVMANGVFMLLVAVLGFSGSGRETGGCLRAYSWLLGLALLGHITLMCFCFFDKDRVVRWVEDESDVKTERGRSAVRYVNDHTRDIAWILLAVSGLEITCFLISCCAPNKVLLTEAEEYARFKEPLVNAAASRSSRKGGADDSLTARQRERMRAKYGDQFSGPRYDTTAVEMDE